MHRQKQRSMQHFFSRQPDFFFPFPFPSQRDAPLYEYSLLIYRPDALSSLHGQAFFQDSGRQSLRAKRWGWEGWGGKGRGDKRTRKRVGLERNHRETDRQRQGEAKRGRLGC